MRRSSLEAVLRGMKRPTPGLHYYFLELIGQPDGQIIHSAYTEWVGFSKSSPRREIRKGSLVRPQYFIPKWKELSIPFVVVNTEPQMMIYLFIGGTALVEKALGEQYFSNEVLPHEVVPDGRMGFKSPRNLPAESFFRAPRPKLRMKVLKRDQYRCRICGRRSADDSDLELHVHHIRPWARGGITEEQNLITLCHTCHHGLAPHQDPGLFDLLDGGSPDGSAYADQLRDGMRRYQALMGEAYRKIETIEPTEETRADRSSIQNHKTPNPGC